MMLFVLDTDTLTLFEEGHPGVCEQVLQHSPEAVAITVLSVEEQLSGWYTQLRQAKRPERLAWAYRCLAETVRLLARLKILTYDEKAMQRFEDLRKQKIKIGRTDLRIAATVLEYGATLVTENLHDFQQVPGLTIASWAGRAG
jgi:tRNA(fMet)-specific endonuclease VapC